MQWVVHILLFYSYAVLPTHPADLTVDQTSPTTTLAMWTLTNQTADEGADYLALRLTYSNNRSLVRQTDLSGDKTSKVLDSLAPSTNYSLQLVAINIDGQAASEVRHFTTLEGKPFLNSVQVEQLNHTHFDIVVDVAYTGGGQLHSVEVWYGPGLHSNLVDLEALSGLKWRAQLVLDEEEVQGDLEFTVSVRNQFAFQSNDVEVVGELSLSGDD